MINTDKHDWDNQTLAHEVPHWMRHMYDNALMIIARNEAEVKRLQKEIEVLSKYRDIVEKYDDALLADGDTDPRWSELYD